MVNEEYRAYCQPYPDKGCIQEFLYNQITAVATICIEIPAYTLYFWNPDTMARHGKLDQEKQMVYKTAMSSDTIPSSYH